ncbi:hypothetical protein [Microbacterium sp. SA39]|uniref:hypothetical protein n=1 Tax=Microbacterium sp. SA39 TaxID=1263625 RepID=UPI0005FA031A|nr:hypothetical protein [Microbacterium sp. SA39]KJQ55471.1 hypothetical protein RS85_00750 [Microbacterium sp. SA39]
MSDGSGTTPDQSLSPEEPAIAPADTVIPPPPPEIPIPDGLLTPPPSEGSVPDPVIPPPPPEARLRSSERPRPAILQGDQPAAVADDWAKPSVAPEVPTSGGYRGLTVAIFAFLLLLLLGAVAVGIYLLSTGSFPFFTFGAASAPNDLTPLF